MKELEIYLSLSITILGLLISTVTFLSKFIKSAKAKKYALGIIKISEEVIPFIKEAEKFIHYSGVEKKAYVMMKAIQVVINNKLKLSEALLSDTIDELVDFTKHVNNKNINNSPNQLENNKNYSNEVSKKELGKLYN
jgi:hypothetical protein